jgi:hypothetical protein
MSGMPGRSCRGLTKSGEPCKAPPTGDGLCYFHAHPEQARILGQKGGRKNGCQVTEVTVPENVTMSGLGVVLDQTMRELLAGRLEPRVAAAVAQFNTRRRVTETADLEIRIAELERKLRPRRAGADTARAPAESPDCTWPRKENAEGTARDEHGDIEKA